jgi:hypothetical protein
MRGTNMKTPWIAAAAAGLIGWRWKSKRRIRIGRLDGALGLAGIATLLVGASFVDGAVKDNEPRAAATACKLFGTFGTCLVMLACLTTWFRNRSPRHS